MRSQREGLHFACLPLGELEAKDPEQNWEDFYIGLMDLEIRPSFGHFMRMLAPRMCVCVLLQKRRYDLLSSICSFVQ